MKAIKLKKYETLINCWAHLFLQKLFLKLDKGTFEHVLFFSSGHKGAI